MLNVYPQRATNTDYFDEALNKKIHKINIREIEKILKETSNPNIWAAWGTLIKKRPYLIECLQDIYEKTMEADANWISIGKRSKEGHPHHPIALSYGCDIEEFDIREYIKKFKLK